MKKVIMLAAIVAAMASCQSKTQKNTETKTDSVTTTMDTSAGCTTEIYKGTLPAADGTGISYVLSLNAAANGRDTTFTLNMTYLDADGKGNNKTFTSKGKKETIHKEMGKTRKTAVKLSPDNGEAPMYFLVIDNNTLRLVGNDLEESVTNLNYDIVKAQ